MNVMLTRMQKMIQRQTIQSKSLDFVDFVDFVESTKNKNDDNNVSCLQIKEIEFYDFKYDEKSTFEDFSLENTNKKIIYRDVHVFISRVKDYAKIHDTE